MSYICRNGKVFEKGPKGEEPVGIIVVNGRISIALGGLGISKKDADKIISRLSIEEKVRALNDKNFMQKIIVTYGE